MDLLGEAKNTDQEKNLMKEPPCHKVRKALRVTNVLEEQELKKKKTFGALT